jgi:hypothetical protein
MTKYIKIQHHYIHHYIREKVDSNELQVFHVPSKENIAEIFTKPLGRVQFEVLRDELGLVRIPTNS